MVVERSWAGGTALNHNGSNIELVCHHLGVPAEIPLPRGHQPRRQASRTSLRSSSNRTDPGAVIVFVNEIRDRLRRLSMASNNQSTVARERG